MFSMKAEKNIAKLVENSYELKPEHLFMKELKWKYLVRSALRGKNILLIGPTGQGKTFAVQCLVEALSEIVEEEMTEEQLNALKSDPNITIIKTETMWK